MAGREACIFAGGNRLAKIIFEQNATEEKEMTIGESWELGEGYNVIANSISAKDTGGRQAWITLFKDANKLVDTVMAQYGPNKFFTYQMNLSDGTPNFMIYYSRVDSLRYTDAAYFKYTWLRSQKSLPVLKKVISSASWKLHMLKTIPLNSEIKNRLN
ncbi:S-layer protein [uncultured archaeon]|nr:S-layer protein [uncultured archaeon]